MEGVNFDLYIDGDGDIENMDWELEDYEEEWTDVVIDEEMENLLTEIDVRINEDGNETLFDEEVEAVQRDEDNLVEFYRKELERTEMGEDDGIMEILAYLESRKNPNTKRKTESVVMTFK